MANGISALGEVIGGSISSQERMNSDLTGRDSTSTWFVMPNSVLKIRVKRLEIQRKNIRGKSLIWGHPTNGIWGTHMWGDDQYNSFLLDDSVYGILDSIPLEGTVANTYSSILTDTLNTQLTIDGRNEIRNWLGNSTALRPTDVVYGNGTAAYSILSSFPATQLGYSVIGTSVRDSNKLRQSAEIYSVNVGTGTCKSSGLYNPTGSILFMFNNLTSTLAFDINNNYKFIYDTYFSDASGAFATWTDVGTSYIADWFGGTTNLSPKNIGFGTGTTAVSALHTTLEGEFVRPLIDNFTYSLDVINYWSTILDENTGNGTTITRSGIWDAGTASGTAARLLIENKHFDIEKTSLFQIDLEHRNELD